LFQWSSAGNKHTQCLGRLLDNSPEASRTSVAHVPSFADPVGMEG